ncbi:MAG TPA: DUF2141 domain-containing protein [Treponemataceae bacterium]|nr:DUF2141 domain-containing protein [Treponemataceae bacterium]
MTNKTGVAKPDNATVWRAIWIATLALGIFMTFFRIGADSYWYDESYSVAAARHPIAEMVPMIADDSHPPLYYMALRAVTLVAGDSPTAVRGLSAIGILALASLGFFMLRKIWGNRGGFAFSLAVLVTPMSIAASREARMYTWLAFFVTAMVIQGYFALSGKRKRDWVILSLLTLGASYTHYYGLMAAALYWLVLIVAVLVMARESGGTARLRTAFITAAVTVVAYVPWAFALLRQAARVSKNFWIPKADLMGAIRTLSYPFMQRFPWAFNGYAFLAFLAVFAIAVAAVIVAVSRKRNDAFLVVSALAVYVLTFVGAYALSVTIKPILYERYFTAVMGLLILCFASFVGNLKRSAITWIALAVYALVAFPVLGKIYSEEINGPLDLAKAELAPLVKPGDVFVHGSEHTFGLFRYAFPNNEHYLWMPDDFVPFGNHAVFGPNASTGHDLTKYNEKPVTIWLVGREGEYYKTPYIKVFGANHRKVLSKMMRFSKQPGWLNIVVYQVGWDPTKENGQADKGAAEATTTLSMTVTGIESARGGNILYALYDQEQMGPSTFIASGAVAPKSDTVSFQIPDIAAGEYALMVFHDQNANNAPDIKNDTFAEGIAVGIDVRSLGRPFVFDDVKFAVSPSAKTRSVKMYYPK